MDYTAHKVRAGQYWLEFYYLPRVRFVLFRYGKWWGVCQDIQKRTGWEVKDRLGDGYPTKKAAIAVAVEQAQRLRGKQKTPKKYHKVSFSRSEHQAAMAYAQRHNLSLSALIRRAVKHEIMWENV